MCNVFIIYGQLSTSKGQLWTRKQLINTQSKQAFSSGPDTDYRCHETWNLIASTLSFDAMSCLQSSANTWLWHLCSAGLSGDGNCHFVVSVRGLEAHVWGKTSGHCDSNPRSGCAFGHLSCTTCPIFPFFTVCENKNVWISWLGHSTDFNLPSVEYKFCAMSIWTHICKEQVIENS